MAMFFGDCKLPEHGDIQMDKKLIEIKGSGGTIAPRIGQRAWLTKEGEKTANWKFYPNRIRSKSEASSMLTEIGVKPKDL